MTACWVSLHCTTSCLLYNVKALSEWDPSRDPEATVTLHYDFIHACFVYATIGI